MVLIFESAIQILIGNFQVAASSCSAVYCCVALCGSGLMASVNKIVRCDHLKKSNLAYLL